MENNVSKSKNKNKEKPIGIFDSGKGGLSVLAQAQNILPHEKYIYFSDSKNAPYGIKEAQTVEKLTLNAVENLIRRDVKALVLACNTATSAAVATLRKKYKIPIIGMEPAIKPAANISPDSGKIVLLATEMTLQEQKLQNLVSDLNLHSQLIKVPAPKMVTLIEDNQFKKNRARKVVKDYLNNINLKQVSSIVLGCTHFVFYKKIIREIVNNDIDILDGNKGTVRHLERKLRQKNMLRTKNSNPRLEFFSSDSDLAEEKYEELLASSYLNDLLS